MYKLKHKHKFDKSRKYFIYTTQKIKQKISYRALILYFFMVVGAIILRVLLQPFPSVEPLLAFINYFSFYFGKYFSLSFSLYAYYVSNTFMFGGNGVWTIYQTISAVLIAYLSYLFSHLSKSVYMLVFSSIVSVVVYEIIINVGIGGFNIFYFTTSLPFSFVHVVSTISFSLMLYGVFNGVKK